jgi:DNA polymerase III subunit beta
MTTTTLPTATTVVSVTGDNATFTGVEPARAIEASPNKLSGLQASVPQAGLKRGLKLVSHAVASGNTLPVLGNVRLQSEHGRGLTLQATNLEFAITVPLSHGVTVRSEGATTLSARLLADVIGALPDEVLTLTHDPDREATAIVCSRFETTIHGIEAAEFPTIPAASASAATTRIAVETLRAAIDQVAFAAATDDLRPALTGVLLTLKNSTATLAAADGYRLARKTLSLVEPVTEPHAVIVPARALAKLAALLADVEGEVDIAVAPDSSQVAFATSGLEVVTRVIDGTYPDISRVIPSTHTTSAEVATAELAKAVKLASFFAASAANIVRLRIESGEAGALTIAANASQVGDNIGQVAATVTGESGEVALNAKFLAEVLGEIRTATVRLELQSARHPAVLRPVGDDTYIHIIMPMTVR